MSEGEIMTIKNKKFGFTLAEALMALLVISLITIASIPVITKKKRRTEFNPAFQGIPEVPGFNGYGYDMNVYNQAMANASMPYVSCQTYSNPFMSKLG